jgi:hypothetical protein
MTARSPFKPEAQASEFRWGTCTRLRFGLVSAVWYRSVRRPSVATLCGLLLLLTACPPAKAQEAKPAETPAKTARTESAQENDRVGEAVNRLVEQFRRHPARPSASTDEQRTALYLIDLETHEITLIADEPDPGLLRIGSPSWSHDGRYVLLCSSRTTRPADGAGNDGDAPRPNGDANRAASKVP